MSLTDATETYAARLRATDQGRQILASHRDLIRDRSARPYVDAISQPYSGWTDGEVAALAQVHSFVTDGRVRKVRVPVEAEPGRDKDRDGNRALLAAGLPEEFTSVIYDGNSHQGDGLLSWTDDTPLPFSSWHTSAPLEVGYTNASRTYLHLLDTGIVARWPYGSEDIWIIGFADYDMWAEWRLAATARIAA